MAKVTRNPIVRGIQGSVGRLVFREMPNGETWVSGKPDFSNRTFSEGQKAHQSKFQQASAYAREAAKREPIYAELARGTVKSPYNVALSDWFHAPVVHEVRREAGLVRVRATDNVKVVRVRVTVLDEAGMAVESKEAVQVDADWWEVGCDAERVVVEALDLAGNVGEGKDEL
jgi:hypothetical protein